jgi:ElaB/YqjD/DUF883 family membrane-anchored ribosome-binding protein
MHSQANTPESGANEKSGGSSPADESQSGVSREFYNCLADIEDLIKETTALSGEELTRAKAKLDARIAEAKESAEVMGGMIANRARQTASASNSAVHQQP